MRPPALRAAPANGAESAALSRTAPLHRHHRRFRFSSRRGSILALSAGLLVMSFAFAAFSVDIGYLGVAKNQLQTAADAAACAGILVLDEGQSLARQAAIDLAEINSPGHGTVLKANDVTFGVWDSATGTFTPDQYSPNAIQVVVRRASSNSNPVSLFFAPIIGHDQADVTATAIAVLQEGGNQVRFLIDDDFIDSDIPAIEELAVQQGVSPGDLISDRDGDWFIDLPPGAVLELPTGQVGDPGLFDIGHPAFPFGKSNRPTVSDFLNYNENGGDLSKGGVDDPEVKALLDPLVGVSSVDDQEEYASYPDPDAVHVSPVFMSDISALNPVYPVDIPTEHGVPAVNALGLRRGLLAFKIIGVGSDPDGPDGSVLPNLIIEIVDPATININNVGWSAGGSSGAVTLVR